MNFFRVGVIDFFGILCPGILALINLSALLFICNVEIDQVLQSKSTENWGIVLPILLLVICYLFGFILRLITPDYVDKASTLFGKLIAHGHYSEKSKLRKKFKNENKISKKSSRRDRKKAFRSFLENHYDELIKKREELPEFFWNDECYPYYFGLKYFYYKDFPYKIAHAIIDKKEYHNKSTYNFWKRLLASRDPNLATLVFQAEAYVRFMSGSFWALVIGILSGILLIITNPGSGKNMAIGISLTAMSILMAVIILNRFKNQRRREVKILLDAIFVASKAEQKIDLLIKDFFA